MDPLLRKLGVESPIVQAPMGLHTSPDMPIGVCKAGGLGSFPCAGLAPAQIRDAVAKIRAHTDLPIAVGFGISTPDQARTVAASAEAIVVGSAIVNQIAEHGKSPDLVNRVKRFVSGLVQAVRQETQG